MSRYGEVVLEDENKTKTGCVVGIFDDKSNKTDAYFILIYEKNNFSIVDAERCATYDEAERTLKILLNKRKTKLIGLERFLK